MMTTRRFYLSTAATLGFAVLLAGVPSHIKAQNAVAIDADDIGGVVTGASGPEAGVWVIAETADLPTKFAKVVVTDDQGRYVIPDLPKAKYKVWVRGYGLVDSAKVDGEPGKNLNLTAVKAPNEAAAAEYYPGVYWYSMLKIPAATEFPGTGEKGNGIPEVIKSQHAWIDTVKNSCQSCHALGSKGVRTIPKELGKFSSHYEAWVRRLQSGQAMSNMTLVIGRLGPKKGLDLYADWTERVEKGELPFAKPERPTGRRAQRRHQHVGLGQSEALSPRRDLDRQAQSDGQCQRPDLRIARREHGLRSRA